MSEISDEFKIVVVEAIQTLCPKFPRKHNSLMTFLAGMLREEVSELVCGEDVHTHYTCIRIYMGSTAQKLHYKVHYFVEYACMNAIVHTHCNVFVYTVLCV